MYDRVSKHQEQLIEDLQRKVDDLEAEIEDRKKFLVKRRAKAHFYMNIENTIANTPGLVEDWSAFLILIKFTLDSPVKGITYE